MKKKRRPRLANGWRWIQRSQPPQHPVLVSNNPRARDAFWRVNHVWIVDSVFRLKANEGFAGWVAGIFGHQLVQNLQIYHELPGPAYEEEE